MTVRILNEELTFETLPEDVKRSFVRGFGKPTLLHSGHELYKFTSHPIVDATTGLLTAYWSSVKPLGLGDTGLDRLMESAGLSMSKAREIARVRSAVSQQWNGMRTFVRIWLPRPAWCFTGRCSGQPANEDNPKVIYIGGAWQVWLPNLHRMPGLVVRETAID